MVTNINNNAASTVPASKPAPVTAASERGNDMPTGGKDLPPAPKIDISGMVQQINDFMHANSRSLQFHFDNRANRAVITVVNPSSGEVIRQIPSEEAVRLAAQIEQMLAAGGQGVLNIVDQLA